MDALRYFSSISLATIVNVAVIGGVSTVSAQPLPDADTLLLMQFDGSADVDYSLGSPPAAVASGSIEWVEGRFGGAADMSTGSRITLVGGSGNFNPAEGTIEFWIKPHWSGDHPESHTQLTCGMGENKYVKINTLGGGRLGLVVTAGEGDDWTWKRADANVEDWQPDEWHHVAATWGQGQMRVYVDGVEGRRSETDVPMPVDLPEQIIISAEDSAIDALRISKRLYTADDVERSIRLADNPPYRYLNDLTWTPADAVVIDGRTLLGDVSVPLVLGATHYRNALGLRAGNRVSAELSEPCRMLVGKLGVCSLSSPGDRCTFEVYGDGRRLFESPARSSTDPPLEIRVPIEGVRQLAFLCQPVGGGTRPAIGVWAGALVASSENVTPLISGRELDPVAVEMYARQEAADDYSFNVESPGPCFVAAKHWEDDVDPAEPPATADVGRSLDGFAVPGEYEPVNFVLYAIEDLENVSVEVTDLTCAASVIPADRVDIRLVLRRLMRDLYTRPAHVSTIVSRYLLENRAVDVPAGTFREYHMIVHVPDDAAAGQYAGVVRISPARGSPIELPMRFEVLPIRFRPLESKAYGMYYRFPSDDDWSGVDVEMADLRTHGCTTLKWNLGVEYQSADGRIVPDYARLKRGLDLLVRHGFRGALPVGSGCEAAARLLKYDPVEDYADEPARQRFFAVVKEGLDGLVRLAAEYPQFEFLPTHMDEVLGRERLDRYIRLTEAVRQVPSFRVYITMHNDPNRDVGDATRSIDPFVDVRCYNGHCMDNWIRAGNTFDDLARQLDESGDEAWIYHNIRGAFYSAEWTRLVNGYYLWISPLKVHVPWMYYSFKGSPFDATDGPEVKGGDFAYAVPDPNDPTKMVPTRHWEAFREGIDDLRYIDTLEGLIADHAGSAEAERARAWLDNLRQGVTPGPGELEPIEQESPLLRFLAEKIDGDMYRKIRRQAAEHIERLSALSN